MVSIAGDPFLYWILKTLLLVTLFICGYAISYKDKRGDKFWLYALPALLAYSFEYGLRWNRSFDYPHYYQDLTGTLYTDYSDPIYILWVNLVRSLGIDPVLVFIFYSALLIYAFLLVLKERRELAFLALPLFMLIPTQADNHIRQYFAFSLIFIGYLYDYKGKKRISFLWYLVGIGIHLSGLFCIAFIQFFRYINVMKLIKSPWILIFLYLFFYFYWDTKNLDGLATWLEKLNLGESSMQNYIDNASYWFTDESDINDKLGIKRVDSKLYFTIITLFTHCALIYFGFKLITTDAFLVIPYWALVWCYFNNVLGGNNEIFSRFSSWVDIFTTFIVSAVILKYPFGKAKILAIILFCYFYLYVGHIRKMSTVSLTGYEYIWDR